MLPSRSVPLERCLGPVPRDRCPCLPPLPPVVLQRRDVGRRSLRQWRQPVAELRQLNVAEMNLRTLALQGDAPPPGQAPGNLADRPPIHLYAQRAVPADDNALIPLIDRLADLSNVRNLVVRARIAAREDAAGHRLVELDLDGGRPDPVDVAGVDQNSAVAVRIHRILPLQAQPEIVIAPARPQVAEWLTPTDQDRLVVFGAKVPGLLEVDAPLSAHENPVLRREFGFSNQVVGCRLGDRWCRREADRRGDGVVCDARPTIRTGQQTERSNKQPRTSFNWSEMQTRHRVPGGESAR